MSKTPHFTYLAREINRILGACDMRGNVTLDALCGILGDTPPFVTAAHESAHQSLTAQSALSHFQVVLLDLVECDGSPEEHRGAYRRALQRSVETSFQTHEAIATYVSWLAILTNCPHKEASFHDQLPAAYRRALDCARQLLPPPQDMLGDMELFASHTACATLTGCLFCALPVLQHYRDWDHLWDAELRYIDYETPDDTLSTIAELRPRFKEKLQSFLAYAFAGLSALVRSEDMHSEHARRLLQEQWQEWNAEFYRLVSDEGFGSSAFLLEDRREHYQALVGAWEARLSELGYAYFRPPNITWDLDAGGPAHRLSVTFPSRMQVTLQKEVSAVDEATSVLTQISKASRSFLIALRMEDVPSRFAVKVSPDGTIEATEAERVALTIAEIEPHLFGFEPKHLHATKVVLPILDINDIGQSITRPGMYWVAEAAPYIIRQLLSSTAPAQFQRMMSLRMPGVILRASTIGELISHTSTVLESYKNSLLFSTIGSRVRFCVVLIADELLFALSDDAWAEAEFQSHLRAIGATSITDDELAAKYGSPDELHEVLILAARIMTAQADLVEDEAAEACRAGTGAEGLRTLLRRTAEQLGRGTCDLEGAIQGLEQEGELWRVDEALLAELNEEARGRTHASDAMSLGLALLAYEFAERINGNRNLRAALAETVGVIACITGACRTAIKYLLEGLTLAEAARDWRAVAACTMQLGRASILLQERDEALAWYRRSLDACDAAEDQALKTGVLESIGILYTDAGDPARGAAYLRDALAIAAGANDEAAVAHISGNLGSAALGAGDTSRSIHYSRIACELSRRTGTTAGREQWLSNLGQGLLVRGEEDEARQVLLEAVDVARQQGNVRLVGVSLASLGSVHRRLGAYQEAVAALDEAIGIARDTGDRVGQSRRMGNLAFVYYDAAMPTQAVTWFEAAIALAAAVGDHTYVREWRRHLAGAYAASGQIGEGVAVLDAELKRAKAAGDRQEECELLCWQGNVYSSVGELRGARTSYEAALESARAVGDAVTEMGLLNNLGNVHLACRDYQSARRRFEEALAAAKRVDATESILRALISLADASERAGEHHVAVQHFEEAIALGRGHCGASQLLRWVVGLARAHHSSGEADTAIQVLANLLAEHGESQDIPTVVTCHMVLGELHCLERRYAQALRSYERARDLAERAGLAREREICTHNVAQLRKVQ